MFFSFLFRRNYSHSKKEIIKNTCKVNEEKKSEYDSNNIFEIIENTSKILSKSSFANISNQIESIKNQIKLIPPKYHTSISLIYNNGWFLEPSIFFSDLLSFSEFIPAQIDDYLIDYYRKNAKIIQKKLENNFHRRKTIINKAFYAHYKKEYELSIPVFLSQTDGIIFDKFSNAGLFQKREREKFINDLKLLNISNKIWISIIEPLEQDLDIFKSEKNRTINFNGLNRHMILHGEDINYANEINSLKCISLLSYISFLCK